MKVATHAAENNKTFMMNLSAPFLSQFFKEPMLAALPFVDILFGNETEAVEFAKNNDLQTDKVSEIALKICSWDKVGGYFVIFAFSLSRLCTASRRLRVQSVALVGDAELKYLNVFSIIYVFPINDLS